MKVTDMYLEKDFTRLDAVNRIVIDRLKFRFRTKVKKFKVRKTKKKKKITARKK